VQPLASLQALADPIYEAFYGLTDQPFALTTDPKFFYLSASHERAFSELVNGLRRREGLLLLTGETGSGKTTLCRAVLDSLGARTFSAMILNPYMTGPEVFRIVLRDFGLVTHEELRRGALASADVTQLLDTLEGFLRSLIPLDTHAVIVLDEAQSLAPQVLDQLRLLTALEADNRRLVQIVLCGQPGLLETLKTDPLRALNERITRRVTLAPLPASEIQAYIEHRLAIAGGTASVSFDPASARVIAALSHGLPRRVNVLCDRALQEGRIDGAAVITHEMVKRGAKSIAGAHDRSLVAPSAPFGMAEISDPSARPWWKRRVTGLMAGVVSLALAFGAVLFGYETSRVIRAAAALPTPPLRPPWTSPVLTGTIVTPSEDEFAQILAAMPRPLFELPENRDQLY
jgi:general secretion pathway protein A